MASEGSRFIVDLGDVKLPRLAEKQVEAEIRSTVLRALAENGFGGESRGPQARISKTIWDLFPGQTLGLWPGWPEEKPPSIFGPAGDEPLTVTDHTLIMRAVMDHPMRLLRYVPSKYKSRKGPRPSGGEVLQAALQVEEIDEYTKGRIRMVLDLLPKIEEGMAALPESAKSTVDDLRQRLANKSVEEKRSVFRDADLRRRHRDDGLAAGMDVAAQILEDGLDSIYSPDHSFYKWVQERRGSSGATGREATMGDVADTDAIVATGGGGAGLLYGGPAGAAVGGVIGGVGGSAGFAIAWAIDSIWDIF
jgi:hypothetical protein